MAEGELFSLSHKGFASQAALLAFLLARRGGKQVVLVAAEESLLRAGHLIAGEAEEDKLAFVRAALQREGVGLCDLREWRRDGLALAADAFAVVDVFGLSPAEWAPVLLRGGWTRAAVYHSHLQDDEVRAVLSAAGRSAVPLQLWTEHPTEAQAARD